MFIVKHAVETKAAPKQIWKIWEDAGNWKTWDEQIEFSHLDGPFQAGTTGATKFHGTPRFRTLLTVVEPYELVVQETYLSCAKVVSRQSMSQGAGITRITFEVEIRGLLSFFYACMIRRSIQKKIPLEMEAMLKRLGK